MTKNNLLVSVIMSAYNEEKHISNCLNSFLNQTYSPVEIIVSDDGSSDRTREIIKEICRKNKNVKLVEQNHIGMAQGWNNAFKKSKGDLLCVVGADMIAGRTFIQDMIQPIIREKSPGSQPKEAKIYNLHRLWARAKGRTNVYADTTYVMMTRDVWKKAGGADIRKGYSADQSFYNCLKIKPAKVETELYDHNPETFHHTWKHSKWYGTSMPARRAVLFTLFFPIAIVWKSVSHFVKDPHPRFLYFLPYYYFIKYLAFLVGFYSAKFFGADVSKR